MKEIMKGKMMFFCYFWLLVGVVCADYQFELQLVRYMNPTHRLASERCCDSDKGLITCIDHCDNSLVICLSAPGQADCSLGVVSTGSLFVFSESDNILLSSGGSDIAAGVANPLLFTGYEWPGGFELLVNVSDEDEGGQFEEVDMLPLSRPRNTVGPNPRFTSSVEIRGFAGRGFLRLNYRLICTGNFTGNDCTQSADPCSPGQCPDTTTTAVDVCTASTPCENGGTCTPAAHTDSGYVCSCPQQFTGSRCERDKTRTQTPPTPISTTALKVPSEGGSEQRMVVAVAVASCTVLVMLGLLLLLLVIVILLLCQRHRRREREQHANCKCNVSEEGMYDNPVYMSSGRYPQHPSTEAGGEEAAYRKVINPLYYSQSPSLLPPSSRSPDRCALDYDPDYATPSLLNTHSHTDMELRPEGSCNNNYEHIE